MSTVISVENISKSYRLGQIGRKTLAEDLNRWWARWRGTSDPTLKVDQIDRGSRDDRRIWALQDVSFTVQQGEVLGIIGRNGAGKSTLLKILSRVTAPTTGHIKVKGRIASILEVGTGFHPELTGRENIYLNGAISGMSKEEVRRKFDEIVDFADIEQFIDTPVKRYSSGMYVRLAFAVAAHLEPEILIVDEVLAVGDAEFQKKCLGKMGDVAHHGRTVLFVSHNMAAITRLCQWGIWLEQGRLMFASDIYAVTSKYLQSGFGPSSEKQWGTPELAPGDQVARLKSIRVLSEGRVTDTVDIRNPVTIEMEYWNLKEDADLLAAFSFINDQNVIAFIATDFHDVTWGRRLKPAGVFRACCTIPGNFLAEGQFNVVAEISTRQPFYETHFLEFDSVRFQVIDKGEPGSMRAEWGRQIPGVVRPMLEWESSYLGK